MQVRSRLSIVILLMTRTMWLTSIFYPEGKGDVADVVTSCPRTFLDGEVHNITCTINSTSISNAQCLSSPSNIDFKFTYVFGSSDVLCSSAYPATSCAAQRESKCFCKDHKGDLFTYQFNFVGDKSYQKGSFKCSICEITRGAPLKQEISPTCTAIEFATSTVAAATTTTRIDLPFLLFLLMPAIV